MTIYLDYAATTPVDARVAAAMAECLSSPEAQGNPASATHGLGLAAHERVEAARAAVAALIGAAPAAVLFGAERTGLTNDELALAHLLIRIPANPDYPSLNLGMAVQLVCYELFRAAGSPASSRPLSELPVPLAAGADMDRFYPHLAEVMEEVEFRDRTQSGTQLMTRIRRLFQRCEMDQNEVNILRGFLTSVQSKRRPAGKA